MNRDFLVGSKIGIGKSLETGRDKRASQRDKNFIICVGDSCPVISTNNHFLIAYLPSSVISLPETKTGGVGWSRLTLQREDEYCSLPKMQCSARLSGMIVHIEDWRNVGEGPCEPTLGVRMTAQIRVSAEGEKFAKWTSRGDGRCRRSKA